MGGAQVLQVVQGVWGWVGGAVLGAQSIRVWHYVYGADGVRGASGLGRAHGMVWSTPYLLALRTVN